MRGVPHRPSRRQSMKCGISSAVLRPRRQASTSPTERPTGIRRTSLDIIRPPLTPQSQPDYAHLSVRAASRNPARRVQRTRDRASAVSVRARHLVLRSHLAQRSKPGANLVIRHLAPRLVIHVYPPAFSSVCLRGKARKVRAFASQYSGGCVFVTVRAIEPARRRSGLRRTAAGAMSANRSRPGGSGA